MITPEQVSNWGGFSAPTGEDLAFLERIIAAVTETLSKHFYIDDPMTDSQEQAVLMQSYRYFNRKGDPSGIAAFADIAARSITGLDKDVMDLLDARINFA